jgi:glutathione S-transferase
MMTTLFGDLESGNVHKVQLLLRRLDVPYRRVDVSQSRGDTRRPEFLALNPIGKVPALLLDDGDVISESGAILYLFGCRSELWPADERARAEVLRWMFFEQYSHEPALAVLRYLKRFAGDPAAHAHRFDDLAARAARALRAMEVRLGASAWIAGDRPTLADYALYPYTRWAGEADVDLQPYPAVSRWLAAFEALPAFLPLRTDGATTSISFDSFLAS